MTVKIKRRHSICWICIGLNKNLAAKVGNISKIETYPSAICAFAPDAVTSVIFRECFKLHPQSKRTHRRSADFNLWDISNLLIKFWHGLCSSTLPSTKPAAHIDRIDSVGLVLVLELFWARPFPFHNFSQKEVRWKKEYDKRYKRTRGDWWEYEWKTVWENATTGEERYRIVLTIR